MTLLSIASLVFAMAGSLEGLLAARFVQGLSSAMSWSGALGWLLSAAPRQHRGHLLGVALGAGIFGAVFGPVLGSVAALTSREVVFIGVAALAGVTALWSLSIHYKRPRESSSGALPRALRTTTFLAGLAMMVLPAVLIGIVLVLGPLHLAHYGWGAAAIGGVWLVTAVIQSSISPVLGQMSDRRGPQAPIRLPLPYAVLLVALSTTYGGLYSPAFALIAKGAEEARLNQGVAFAVMNMAWALGAVVGPAAGGAIAQTEGDRIPLLISAGICAVAAVGLLARSRRQIPDTPAA
jgi:MFS family permease